MSIGIALIGTASEPVEGLRIIRDAPIDPQHTEPVLRFRTLFFGRILIVASRLIEIRVDTISLLVDLSEQTQGFRMFLFGRPLQPVHGLG